MKKISRPKKDKRASIVCSHIASGLPMLRAIRGEPVEVADSGWQFLCDSGLDEEDDEAQVWAFFEVGEHTPSLEPYLDLPPGTIVCRTDEHSSWEVSKT